MKRALPITLRLTLLFAAASALVLALLGTVLVRVMERHFEEQDIETLQGELARVSRSLQNVGSPADHERLGEILREQLVGHERMTLAIFDAEERLLFSTTAVEFPPALRRAAAPAAAGLPPVRSAAWTSGAQHYRGIAEPVSTRTQGPAALTVGVAVNVAPHMDFMRRFKRAMFGTLAACVAAMGLLSWLVARRGLAPLQEVAQLARQISAERLDERLPLHAIPAEMRPLARAFNGMLERLATAFRRQAEFSSDVAHELRTPISSVMTQTQVALAADRSAAEYRELLHSMLEEHESLARTVSDMLFLSQGDNGLLETGREAVDLVAETRSLRDYYDALVADKRIELRIDGIGTVRGDRLMLRRAVANLLSNAIRHTAEGGTIEVRVGRAVADGGGIELTVTNPGPDIAPQHVPHLFDRFYQVDPSRRRTGEGAGLGLAIAKSIAQAHGAAIGVRSAAGQTSFAIRFPVERTVAAPAAPNGLAARDAGRTT